MDIRAISTFCIYEPLTGEIDPAQIRTRQKSAAGDMGMASNSWDTPDGDRIGEVICAVQLPLENVEYALDQYLLDHGPRLDTETRVLLAGVRDCVGRVVVSARRLSRREGATPPRVGHAA
jgi:hypothetical protein